MRKPLFLYYFQELPYHCSFQWNLFMINVFKCIFYLIYNLKIKSLPATEIIQSTLALISNIIIIIYY